MHWLAHLFGVSAGDANGSPYLFWSGAGGLLVDRALTAMALLAVFAWHQQCHVTGCYWPARRVTAANERACWRHHPHPRRTAADIHRDHHLYLGSRPGRG